MNNQEYIEYFKEQIKTYEERFLISEINVIEEFFDDSDIDVTFSYYINNNLESFTRVDHFFEGRLRDYLNEELDREWNVRTDLIKRISNDKILYHTSITNC